MGGHVQWRLLNVLNHLPYGDFHLTNYKSLANKKRCDMMKQTNAKHMVSIIFGVRTGATAEHINYQTMSAYPSSTQVHSGGSASSCAIKIRTITKVVQRWNGDYIRSGKISFALWSSEKASEKNRNSQMVLAYVLITYFHTKSPGLSQLINHK